MDFIQQAAREVMRASSPSGAKASGEVTWYGDLGWNTLTTGSRRDAPRSFETLVLEGFRRNPVVYSCQALLVRSLAEAPIYAYKPSGDQQWERLKDHAAEKLLRDPNPRDSLNSLVQKMGLHFFNGGNTYLRKVRDRFGVPVQLRPIRPDRIAAAVCLEDDEDDIPVAWRIRKRKNPAQTETVLAEDIIHIADIDPLNEIFGMPRLLAAALEVAGDNKATEYVTEVLGNHGSPGTIVSVDAKATPQQIMRAESRWNQKFGAGRGRGKVLFAPGGTAVREVGFNLKDLEFPSLRTLTRESICTVFGVDPMLIAIASAARKGSSLSGTERDSAMRSLWTQTLVPMMSVWEAVLNAHLAPEFGEDVYLFFAREEIEALAPNKAEALDRAKAMTEAGGFTRAEVRAEAGHDPEPEEEDETPFVMPVRVSFLAQEDADGKKAPVPAAFGGEGEEGGDDNGDDDGADDGDESGDGDDADAEGAAAPTPRFLRTGEDFDRVGAAKSVDAFARSREPEYEAAAQRQFAEERDELHRLALALLVESSGKDTDDRVLRHARWGLRWGGDAPRVDGSILAGFPAPPRPGRRTRTLTDIEVRGPVTTESLEEFMAALGERFDAYHEAWYLRYRDLTEDTLRVVAGSLASEVGASFDIYNPLVTSFMESRANLLAGNVTDSTFRAILATMDEGMRNGEGQVELARRVRDVFDEGLFRTLRDGTRVQVLSARDRAMLIARTETTATTNGGSLQLLKTTRVEYWKTWVTQGDDRVRDEHVVMDGVKVHMNDVFPNGLEYPSEPRCRCTMYFDPLSASEIADRGNG